MTSVRASHVPVQPCGKNPPGERKRFDAPTAGAGPTPTISASPTTMKTTMATTLMSANQYSNSPNRLTGAVLMATNAAETPATQTHCGTSGNQKAK